MGYPVREDLAAAAGVDVMSGPHLLGCAKIDKLIGNAMHLAAVGAAILAALVSWEPAPASGDAPCSIGRIHAGASVGANGSSSAAGNDRVPSAPPEATTSSGEKSATVGRPRPAVIGGDDRGAPPCGQAVTYGSPALAP